ncbi:hypothetical protein [Hymenobacter aerophilus]|uniref:hypothetical protein n=1 Tax=Hymenobacter aerophilus TaxID=119644 RepID=UPI000368E04C|nr:hypothetical protein [Hymenobacter aerophilus]
MKYNLLFCEAATGIVLMQDYLTRFQQHDHTTELPFTEIEVAINEAVRHRILAILLMHPEVEVTLFDEQKNYVKTYPIGR